MGRTQTWLVLSVAGSLKVGCSHCADAHACDDGGGGGGGDGDGAVTLEPLLLFSQ